MAEWAEDGGDTWTSQLASGSGTGAVTAIGGPWQGYVTGGIGGAVGAFIPGAGPAVSNLVSKLLPGPRGNLQKFHRNMYPFMLAEAQRSGLPVYCFWFGDVIVVDPSGSFGAEIRVSSNTAAEDYFTKKALGGQSFETLEGCTGDAVNKNFTGCNWVKRGPASVVPGLGGITGGSGLAVLGAIVGGFLVLRRFL